MSTIKVNTIQHSSGANSAITLSSNGDVAFSNNVFLGTNTTFKNKLAVNYTPATSDNAAIYVATANTQGGTGYADFLKVQNTSHPGVTNPHKTFRLNSTGGIEVINSAYSAILATISNEGYITKPNTPMMMAEKNDGNGSWANYSGGKVYIFNYAWVNVGNNYNTTTGIFTCPTTGYYYVSSTVMMGGGGTSYYGLSYLYKNGSQYGQAGHLNPNNGNSYATMTMNYLVSCAAGDTLKIYVIGPNAGTIYENGYSHFIVNLIA